MSFWRDEVIDFALDHETRLHMDEQREWIAWARTCLTFWEEIAEHPPGAGAS